MKVTTTLCLQYVQLLHSSHMTLQATYLFNTFSGILPCMHAPVDIEPAGGLFLVIALGETAVGKCSDRWAVSWWWQGHTHIKPHPRAYSQLASVIGRQYFTRSHPKQPGEIRGFPFKAELDVTKKVSYPLRGNGV